MGNRIRWLDVAKCFGIFLIYLGHCGNWAGNAYSYVFTHHVAFFFLISGCTEAISGETRIGHVLKKVLRNILLPWFVFSIISLMVYAVQNNVSVTDINNSLQIIVRGTVRNAYFASALWFLTCLALVRILFAFIRKLRFQFLIIAVCLACFVLAECGLPHRPIVTPAWIYNADSALYYIVFYAIGYISFPFLNRMLNPNTKIGKGIYMITFAASFVYAALLFFGRDATSVLAQIKGISLFYPIIQTLLVSWTYFSMAKLCENVAILNEVGKSTLYLCGSEFVIGQFFSAALGVMGLSLNLFSPLVTYFYCTALILIGTKLLAPLERNMIGFIQSIPGKMVDKIRG